MLEELSNLNAELKEVAAGVYAYFQLPGTWMVSNAGLIVGKEHNVVVDSLVNEAMISDFISEIRRVADKPARFLINTHHHSDHTWTNHFFSKSTVICHRNCREATVEDQAIDPKLYEMMFSHLKFDGAKVTPQGITFEKELILYESPRQIHMVYSGPAHTKGDIFVYLPQDGVVFCGDLLFYNCTPLALMGYISGWIDVLETLSKLDADIYVPGHGPITDSKGVLECKDYLIHIKGEARKFYEAGLNAYEASLEIDLGPWKSWGDSERIVANVERLYSEFRGEEPAAPLDAMNLFTQMRIWPQKHNDQSDQSIIV